MSVAWSDSRAGSQRMALDSFLLKHLVSAISSRDEVGDQVFEFFLIHAEDGAGWHQRGLGSFDLMDLNAGCSSNFSEVVRIARHGKLLVVLEDDASVLSGAVLQLNLAGLVLFRNGIARVNDRDEDVVDRIPFADRTQIWPRVAPGSFETMTGDATSCCKHSFSVLVGSLL